MYNGPSSGPHAGWVQGEGYLLLPKSSMGTLSHFVIDLRPEAEYTLTPFGGIGHQSIQSTKLHVV